MNCVIPGVNIKVFGRAVQSLSKIGEELYVEPLEHGLALRTVNSSRSAYACFLFAPSFFQHYDDGSGQTTNGSGKEEGEEEAIRCKITMKSCLTVFKSVYTLEKTVERCKIKLDMTESRLVFQLHCRHGIVKTHNLAFIECETLQAVFSKDMCPNSLTASARLLCDAVQNFQNNQEEVTLIVKPDKILLKNYVEDEPDPTKVMHTELRLEPEEFDNIQVGVDSEITFCLKEMRAILAFSEATNLPVSLKFETAGRPIVFSIDSDSAFEANFVLATLADTMTQQGGSSNVPTESKTSQKRKHTSNSRTSVKAINKSQTSRKETESMNIGRANETEEQSVRINEHEDSFLSRRKPNNKSPDHEGRSNRLNAALSELMNDDMDDIMLDQETREEISKQPIPPELGTKSVSGRDRITTRSPVPSTSRENISPLIPLQSSKPQIFNITTEDVEMKENEEEEEELVPGTPPSKRFRSMFFGSQSSTITQSSQRTVTKELSVLAEDTDDEG
ncbi:hypothetical protein ACJMK2_011862 [Sinanodonta woodiana]|uniref:Cell cycle checkpoint control protein RAD9A n=1 Tax=Sinanodonta woodiana TaxID=1069815 RepID=A0ABD3V9H5_SINWO